MKGFFKLGELVLIDEEIYCYVCRGPGQNMSHTGPYVAIITDKSKDPSPNGFPKARGTYKTDGFLYKATCLQTGIETSNFEYYAFRKLKKGHEKV